MSETPKTDEMLALVIESRDELDVRKMVPVGHARGLERENARLRNALEKIAALNDDSANSYLSLTGSFSSFDEPASVEIARAALQQGKG